MSDTVHSAVQGLEQTVEMTIDFLRTYGKLHASEDPVFIALKSVMGFNAEAERDPRLRTNPAYQERKWVDETQEKFDRALSHLPRTNCQQLSQDLISRIPNDPDVCVIDIGCENGRYFTNEFAASHPAVRIFYVDKIDNSVLMRSDTYSSFREPWCRFTGFDKRVPITSDAADTMQRLLRANRLMNAAYVHGELGMGDAPELMKLRGSEGTRTIVTGFRNPRNLGYATVREAIALDAREIHLTLSALDEIKYEGRLFQLIGNQLREWGFNEGEIRKYHQLLHDPSKPGIYEKYTTKEVGPWRFGVMLKQLATLAVARHIEKHGYEVSVSFLSASAPVAMVGAVATRVNYGLPSHAISARKF